MGSNRYVAQIQISISESCVIGLKDLFQLLSGTFNTEVLLSPMLPFLAILFSVLYGNWVIFFKVIARLLLFPASYLKPCISSSKTSEDPPTPLLIKTRPLAIASTATIPKASGCIDGNTATWNSLKKRASCVCLTGHTNKNFLLIRA